ncbi:MAG: lamin tail domain-containing protein [Deltaproteobacteria bacterium]|nr:MAG: lamin tail domain-containing protein [Deltaproteobacteria bacterium]
MKRLTAVALFCALVSSPVLAGAADVILNEYNAVDDADFLENGASDPFWGVRAGNGGDWFELAVITDHLDMRGWSFLVVNRTGSAGEESFSIDLTTDPFWQDIRSGTIITISENLPSNARSYNPVIGRWWINVRPSEFGTYATASCVSPSCLPSQVNWKVSNNDTQITILDASSTVVFGPAGEGIQPPAGIGQTEVFKLEQDPDATITPTSPSYRDGSSSTFGQPNRYNAGTMVQDFSALRSVVPYEPLTTVRINEVLSHSDPGVDWIELYNPTTQAVDISGWFISDSFAQLDKFTIPPGTIVPPGGYVVFDENQLGFGFHSPCDDEAILSAGDGVAPTGPRDFVEFRELESQVPMGRYPNGTGEFVRLATTTPGASNAAPAAGPVMINEIMYHPPDPFVGATVNPEYVELYNPTSAPVELSTDYGGTYGVLPWRITGGIDFDFPAGTTIPAGGYLLVVSFDPVVELQKKSEFESIYGLSPGTPMVGPYSGKLSNFSESVRLRRPDTPEPDGTICGVVGPVFPYVVVDEVTYVDFGEWPEAADGTGASLERIDPYAVGTDPAAWAASGPGGPTPGRANTVAIFPTRSQQKCMTALNKDLAKVAKTSGKDALKCLSDGAKERLGAMTIDDCVAADRKGKIASATAKTAKDFGKLCVGLASDGFERYPSFGATDDATVSTAGTDRPRDLLRDVLGSDLDAATIRLSADKDAAKCQQSLAKDVLRCLDTIGKEFSRCKKTGLADGAIRRTSELGACLGADARGKIAKTCDPVVGRIRRDLDNRCVSAGVDLLAAFSPCGSSDAAAVAACIWAAADCRACRMYGEGDALDLDCDIFDDGVANGSCLP